MRLKRVALKLYYLDWKEVFHKLSSLKFNRLLLYEKRLIQHFVLFRKTVTAISMQIFVKDEPDFSKLWANE